MSRTDKQLKITVVVLTVALILAYAFIVFSPHSHECIEADCYVCALMDFSRSIFLGIVLTKSFFDVAKALFVCFFTRLDTLSVGNPTPVALKVKLSD